MPWNLSMSLPMTCWEGGQFPTYYKQKQSDFNWTLKIDVWLIYLLIGISSRRKIIDESVQPDVDCLCIIIGNWYRPMNTIRGTGDRYIWQRFAQRVQQNLLKLCRPYACFLLHPVTHIVLKLWQTKHIICFLGPLNGMSRLQGVAYSTLLVQPQLWICEKCFIRDAVPTAVGGRIDVTTWLQRLL